MPASPAYLRLRRQYLTEEGRCHRCPRPAEDFYCPRCKRETSERARRHMRLSRLRKDPFGWLLVTLAANRCVTCGREKEWFSKHHCRGCLRTLKG
jgi:hypothetical protein